jgi:hypothetical protein
MSKQYQVILRAFNNVNQKFDLEILQSIELKLDISAIESQEIGELFGISSQTFTIPGNDNSNRFFNNAFDLGATEVVAFSKTVPCQVLVDGQAVFTGKLYIKDIVSDDNKNIVYNCIVTNETIDFKTLVENRTVASLTGSWQKYNHAYNFTNVELSWENKLFSGSVFYPLANYGSQVNDPTSPTIGFTPAGVVATTGSIDNYATPLKISQMKPAIQVKTILDEIFASFNYKYTSSFVNTDYFKSIYMLSTPDEKEGVSFVSMVSQSLVATPTVPQGISSPSPLFQIINFGTKIVDTGGNYNTSTDLYTCKESGSYTIGATLNYNVTASGAVINPVRTFQFQIRVNGAVVYTSNNTFGTATTGIATLPPTKLNLKKGDGISIYGRFVGRQALETFTIAPGQGNSFLRVVGASTSYNGTVNIGSVFPPDLMIKDFIKGLAEKFNLVIEPVRNERNLLRIEPFNDWIDQGTVVDWTQIVDRNVKYKVTSPLLNQARNLYFSDALDNDVLNTNYYSKYNKIYGEYKFTTPYDLASGNKRIGEKFAATPTRFINNSSKVEVPWLCKEETTKALVPFNFKSRLLHKQPFPQYVPQNEAKGNNGTTTGFYYILDGVTVRPKSSYNTALPTYSEFAGGFTAPKSSLHFDSATWSAFKFYEWQEYIPGAFDNYWAFYINEIYDIDARLLTCNVILKPTEIQNIQLNDKIFIDGHYYRINKISGANLVNTDSVEVELLKSAPRKIPYNGRRRILTPRSGEPNAFVDAIIDTYNNDGSITYADFETGAVINDQDIISQVVGIDGKDYYAGTTWNNEEYQVVNPNIISLGPNKYNETLSNVINVGSGNSITDYTANSMVIGDNNIINAYVANDTSSFGYTAGITLISNDTTVNDSTNVVLIQPSGSRTISGSFNNVLINPISDINSNDPTGSVYTGNLRNQGTADFKDGATLTGSVDITGSLCVNGDCWPFGGGVGPFAQTASFISVYDTTDQALDGALTASVMTFNNVDFSRGITLVSGSQFTISTPGAYNLAFSAQLDKTANTKETTFIWLRKNGNDVSQSNTSVALQGSAADKQVAAWNFFLTGSAGDYWELAWTATSDVAFLNAVAAVPGVYPATPSIIATVNSMY